MVLPLGDLEKTRIVPLATYALIALNVVMYLLQLDRGVGFTTAGPPRLSRFPTRSTSSTPSSSRSRASTVRPGHATSPMPRCRCRSCSRW